MTDSTVCTYCNVRNGHELSCDRDNPSITVTREQVEDVMRFWVNNKAVFKRYLPNAREMVAQSLTSALFNNVKVERARTESCVICNVRPEDHDKNLLGHTFLAWEDTNVKVGEEGEGLCQCTACTDHRNGNHPPSGIDDPDRCLFCSRKQEVSA